MTIQDAVTALRRFNIWRRYDGPAGCAQKMPDMKVIGEAVDMVCDYVDHRLSNPKYFTLEELLKSQKALDNKIPNLPSWEVVENLRDLAFVLDVLRDDVNAPIKVSSGFRSAALNKAVNGADTSVHKIGSAADIQCSTMSFVDFAKRIIAILTRRGIKFDQIIKESDLKSKAKWIHLGLYNNSGQQRGQIKDIEIK